MASLSTQFVPISVCLADLVGEPYVGAVCQARAALSGESLGELTHRASQRVDLYPDALSSRLASLLPRVGEVLCVGAVEATAKGASTAAFDAANQTPQAPLSGLGYFRVTEGGRLCLTSKSEHYHLPLGHSFPGYRLLEIARSLGIPNATHNNTRGHITRLLEEKLVRVANGVPAGDVKALDEVLASRDPGVMNRVLNLETGSLAAEAALKMCLARFTRSQEDSAPPPYAGRTPVVLVLGNDEGGLQGNYHGTTLITQMLRGMWPDLAEALDRAGNLRVVALRPNNLSDLEEAFLRYEEAPFKVAGFFHEIVMMNYGARLLSREFLGRAYELCAAHDVPVVADEIQSCVWAPDTFLFREYGLRPSFLALGKGFPGGEYPASRVLFSAAFDNLPQFGALVTNGQEEIASLAYLVTLAWTRANANAIRAVGDYYSRSLERLAADYADQIAGIEGSRHLSGICFRELDAARAFVTKLQSGGVDISVQTYKAQCPPVVLTKLPLICGTEVVDLVVERMREALGARQD